MNSQLIAQWCLVVAQLFVFLVMVYRDFNGRPAKPPGEFSDFVASVVSTGVSILVLWLAGAFSLIIGH